MVTDWHLMKDFEPEQLWFQLYGVCKPCVAVDTKEHKFTCPAVEYMNELGYKSAEFRIIKDGEPRSGDCFHEVGVTNKEEACSLDKMSSKDSNDLHSKLNEICFACKGNLR